MSLDKSVVETLEDHEERIDELEQNGGGGGGTPGHVICNVVEDEESPLEPVPQRANLVFFSDAGKVEVQDFEELDATVVLIPEGGGGGGGNPSQIIYDLETPNGQAHAYAYVSGFYDENTDEEQVSFQVDLRDSDNHMTEIYMTRGTEGQLLVLNLDQADPSAPSFSMVNHSAFGDPEFRLTKAPTLIETPTKPAHAATKAYVDSITGLNSTIAEGELPLTRDTGNDVNVSAAAAGPLRFTRIGRTVTLSGLIQLTADSAGAATAAFTGIAGAALPATNNTWRGIITDQSSGAVKNLNIMVYSGASGFRYTVVGAEAGASYRLSFVMVYRSAA